MIVAFFFLPDGDNHQLPITLKKKRLRKKLSKGMRQRLLCREKRSSETSGSKRKSVIHTDDRVNDGLLMLIY